MELGTRTELLEHPANFDMILFCCFGGKLTLLHAIGLFLPVVCFSSATIVVSWYFGSFSCQSDPLTHFQARNSNKHLIKLLQTPVTQMETTKLTKNENNENKDITNK